jgi:hypothetical protein
MKGQRTLGLATGETGLSGHGRELLTKPTGAVTVSLKNIASAKLQTT